MNGAEPLKAVDGLALPAAVRALLRPGELVGDRQGRLHRLPRFFFEVPTWEEAKARAITPHFTFAELLSVDCREADALLNTFPHYIPCAAAILAHFLERLRTAVDAPVFIAVNGGYRSPSHRHSATAASPHNWACAVNIYRIGDTWLDDEKSIERHRKIVEGLGAPVWAKPYGHGPEEADDHLHLDIGYVTHVPAHCGEETDP